MSDYSDTRRLELKVPEDVQAAAQVRLYGSLCKGGGPVPTDTLAGALDRDKSTVTRQSIGDIPVPVETVAGLAQLSGEQACRVLAPLLFFMASVCPDELAQLLRDVAPEVGHQLEPIGSSGARIQPSVAELASNFCAFGSQYCVFMGDGRLSDHEKDVLADAARIILPRLQQFLADYDARRGRAAVHAAAS